MSLRDVVYYAAENNPVPTDSSNATTIALIGFMGLVVTAALTVFGQVVVAKLTHRAEQDSTSRRPRRDRYVDELDRLRVWERWMLINGFDPEKIQTGDENLDEVRIHAAT
jgi:hypothetical protein